MFVETKTMRKAIADAFLTPTKHIRNVSPNPSSIRCPAISSDLIHRFAGMPPFLCFDPNQSNLQFTTLSSRLRQFHLVIDPDLSLRFLFPSSFLTLPETPQIVVVDDRVDLSFLKPFLPDTAGIHQVRFPDSSEGFLRPFRDANVRILRFSDVKSGEKATVPVEKGDLVEVAIKAVAFSAVIKRRSRHGSAAVTG